MEKFINVKDAPKQDVKQSHISDFIKIMNENVMRGKNSINNVLDAFSALTDAEYQIAYNKAVEAGWTLERFEDNYNSTTYKISPIEENDD